MTSDISHGFAGFFFAAYVLFLFMNTFTVICRHQSQNKKCSRTNCSFIWGMLAIFAVSLGVGIKVANRKHLIDEDLSKPCDSNFREDNPTSLLARLDEIELRAQKLLCSPKCPCIMSRIISGGNMRDLAHDGMETHSSNSTSNSSVAIGAYPASSVVTSLSFEEDSAFNVQMCDGYLDNVFIGDSASRHRVEQWL
jgi:hypothetical protein